MEMKRSEITKEEGRPTSVYLNCCSTFLTTLPQSKHLKVPWRSSGLTSLVRVTTPETDTSFPISAVVSSLKLQLGLRCNNKRRVHYLIAGN